MCPSRTPPDGPRRARNRLAHLRRTTAALTLALMVIIHRILTYTAAPLLMPPPCMSSRLPSIQRRSTSARPPPAPAPSRASTRTLAQTPIMSPRLSLSAQDRCDPLNRHSYLSKWFTLLPLLPSLLHTRTVLPFHRQMKLFSPPNHHPRCHSSGRPSLRLLQCMASLLPIHRRSPHRQQLRRRTPALIPALTHTRAIIPIPTPQDRSRPIQDHPVRTIPGRRSAPVVILRVPALLIRMLRSSPTPTRKMVRTSARVSVAPPPRDGMVPPPSSTRHR